MFTVRISASTLKNNTSSLHALRMTPGRVRILVLTSLQGCSHCSDLFSSASFQISRRQALRYTVPLVASISFMPNTSGWNEGRDLCGGHMLVSHNSNFQCCLILRALYYQKQSFPVLFSPLPVFFNFVKVFKYIFAISLKQNIPHLPLTLSSQRKGK